MSLEEAIRDAAVALSPRHANRLADSLSGLEGPGPAALAAASGAVPLQLVRAHATKICEAWMSSPDVPGTSVAMAVRTASASADAVRRSSSVEITWTGPAAGIPVRMTGEVILDLVRGASRSLVFMSYSASEITELVEEITRACDRGVEVTMVFETKEGAGGALTRDASDAYAALKGRAHFYEWPRAETQGYAGRMHAKAVIADAEAALVSSANLSRAAMGSNMELGLLMRGGSIPSWLADHVHRLVVEGLLRESD